MYTWTGGITSSSDMRNEAVRGVSSLIPATIGEETELNERTESGPICVAGVRTSRFH